jgi:NADPH:quinone reductase-like Zn-dependent oxidoreductase
MVPPKSQQALVVKEAGKPVQLVKNHPVPEPGPNQVLLKVNVAGFNPHDGKARDTGLFIGENLPAVLTNDVVGKVVALGPGVNKYEIGDRVLSHAGFTGTSAQNGLQEYAVNDIGAGFKIPDSIAEDEAATLPTSIIAPLVGLFDDENGVGIPAPWTKAAEAFDYKGSAILIVGGGSNCGKFAVQLANLAGLGTIIVVGGSEQELKGYGATDVLDRHGGEKVVLDRIRNVIGDNLRYVFDAVNLPVDQTLGLNAMSPSKGGKMARLLPRTLVPPGTARGDQEVDNPAGFEVFDVLGLSQIKSQLAYAFWERVPDYLTSGKIKPLKVNIREGLTAENANAVLDGYRNGEKGLKTHIHI